MTTPITSWDASDEYKKIRDVVKKLSVINDHAERGVALIKAYSGYLTKDEDQLQYLIQVVKEHRKRFPSAQKQTLGRQ